MPRRSCSAITASVCAAVCACSSDLACCCTADCAWPAPDDCSSAALAIWLGAGFGFHRGALGFGGGGQDLPAAFGNLRDVVARHLQGIDDARSRLWLPCAAFRRRAPSAATTRCTSSGHRAGELAHFLRVLIGCLGQRAHFVGDDGEAAAVIAGARRLDRRIQRQQVRLIGDAADGVRDLADVLGAPLELGDDLDRCALALGVALDRAHRGADLRRGVRQRRRQSLGAAPGLLGFSPRRGQVGDDPLDRRGLLLRCAGRFLGARPRSAPSNGPSSRVAADASVNPPASSSVAAATRSIAVCGLAVAARARRFWRLAARWNRRRFRSSGSGSDLRFFY